MFQGVRIYLSSMFELDGGWVGQNKFEHCSNCKKRTKLWTLPYYHVKMRLWNYNSLTPENTWLYAIEAINSHTADL